MVFFGLSVFVTSACSCRPVGILENQKNADVVFLGKVVEKRDVTDKSAYKFAGSNAKFAYIFEVKQIHKGRKTLISKKHIIIEETRLCDVVFELNKSYLVYAHRSEDMSNEEPLHADNCDRTRKRGFFTFLEQLVLEFT